MIHKLAQKIAEYLNQQLNFGDSRQSIISYGLEIMLGGLVKLVSFISIPAVFGMLPQTWAAMLAATFFRLPAGGAHLTAYYRCLIGYLLTFCLIGVFAKVTASYIPVDLLFLITLGLALIAAAIWAPADTEAKPLTRPADKRKAKIWAFGVLAFYLYIWITYDIPTDLLLAGSVGLLLQVFTITPSGYWIMDKLDRFLFKITFPLIGRKEVT